MSGKVDSMLTDATRTHRHIAGDPDICPVYQTHKVFSTPEVLAWSAEGCRSAGIGCRDCKGALKESLGARLAPIAERRSLLEADPDSVERVLAAGAEKARAAASETMGEVRRAMRIDR